MEKNLVQNLENFSGLEHDFFNQELTSLLERHGKVESEINLESLREILAAEIQDVLLQLKRESEMDGAPLQKTP